jgi:hypothetical protein
MYNLKTLITYNIHCHYESNHTQGIYSIRTIKHPLIKDNMLDVENCQKADSSLKRNPLE